MTTSTLDAYLTTRADRCPGCGHHPRTQGHGATCSPIAPSAEWPTFVAALKEAAVDGVVHQCDVRPIIRGRIAPKHIGLCWKRARREGLLREIDHERSDDTAGRNSHRLEPVYQWIGVAA